MRVKNIVCRKKKLGVQRCRGLKKIENQCYRSSVDNSLRSDVAIASSSHLAIPEIKYVDTLHTLQFTHFRCVNWFSIVSKTNSGFILILGTKKYYESIKNGIYVQVKFCARWK